MKEDRVKGPKMAGFPSRMANSGTIVAAHREVNVMSEGSKSYMTKSDADYMHDAKAIKGHMCKESV